MGYDTNELQRLLQESFITAYDPIPIPPTLIEIKGIPVCTLGNFSAVIGRAKSRKSYFLLYLIAQAFKPDNLVIKIVRDEEKPKIVYFDTEQSDTKTQQSVDIVAKMCESGEPFEFIGSNLRKHNHDLRIKLIEQYLVDNEGSVSLVIIDGIRDLLQSVNNEEQANHVVTKLMQWSQIYHVHIIVVLHQNKNDYNARGHLGTEITNKAESIISVEYNNKTTSTVDCDYSRDEPFTPFSFEIGPDKIPVILSISKPAKKAKQKEEQQPHDIYKRILQSIFEIQPAINYSSLRAALKDECIKNQLPSGDTKVKEIIATYADQHFLKSKPGPKSTTVYTLSS